MENSSSSSTFSFAFALLVRPLASELLDEVSERRHVATVNELKLLSEE